MSEVEVAAPSMATYVDKNEIYKTIHETCRHAFSLYVTWFTWFIALNFGAFGWLADKGKDHFDRVVVTCIAIAMSIFLGLGIYSGITIENHLSHANEQLKTLLPEGRNRDGVLSASFPVSQYNSNLKVMFGALCVLFIVWAFIGAWLWREASPGK